MPRNVVKFQRFGTPLEREEGGGLDCDGFADKEKEREGGGEREREERERRKRKTEDRGWGERATGTPVIKSHNRKWYVKSREILGVVIVSRQALKSRSCSRSLSRSLFVNVCAGAHFLLPVGGQDLLFLRRRNRVTHSLPKP